MSLRIHVLLAAVLGCSFACEDSEGAGGPGDGGSAAQEGGAGQDGGGTPTTDADAGDDAAVSKGGSGHLLVATSFVPRLVDLSNGSTKEVFGSLLRWPQSPGHLYQHWDVSPDGKQLVIHHEAGGNAPAPDDRIVVYPFDESAPGKSLVKSGGPLGDFTRAPCFADDKTIYVLPTSGGVWKIDPTLDATQTPEKVKDIPNQAQLNGPIYWNRDCSGFVAQGYRSENNNEGSVNFAYFSMSAGTLKQLTQHYGNAKGMTLAQSNNHSSCTGTGCVKARNGGTTDKMGFLPNGHLWFTSNRDMWRDSGNAFQGSEKVLSVDPIGNQAFADLAVYDGPLVRAVSRDGKRSAVLNAGSIEVLDEGGARITLSTPDFNAANSPGFMRFVD